MSPPDSSQPDSLEIPLERAQPAIVDFLDSHENPVENLELVAIAVRDAELERRDVSPEDLPLSAVHDRVTSTHLPALASEGLVEYSRVALAASSSEIESILDDAEPDR